MVSPERQSFLNVCYGDSIVQRYFVALNYTYLTGNWFLGIKKKELLILTW